MKKTTYNPDADRRWAEKNKEHRKYLSYRATCRMFIRKHALKEDLEEINILVEDRIKELE